MTTSPEFTAETGLTVDDASTCADFLARSPHGRSAVVQMKGLQRLSRAFAERPDSMLQELVEAAVELCGADSAGISLEMPNGTDERFYNWIAAAGVYSPFFDAVLPKYPSACSLCLERGKPQHFTVGKRFFDILGIEAPPVTDGLLLPWQAEEARGTIFVMAHERAEAFDTDDARMMELLADFAAMAVRHRNNHAELLTAAGNTGALSLAHRLAHRINNPLQSMTNHIYLAANDDARPEAQQLAVTLAPHLERLADSVRQILDSRSGDLGKA